jgi:sarcosine oxidase
MTRTRSTTKRPVVVIGAGVMGASAACSLAARGLNVILLERHRIGHDQGSSHGESRIIRYSYSSPFYASLMPDAFRAWAKLEADTGTTLYVRTGGLTFGPQDNEFVPRVVANLKHMDVPCRNLSQAEVQKNYPGLKIPKGFTTVFEPSTGVLLAHKVPRLLVELASRIAGNLFESRENFEVDSLDLEGTYPVVIGAGGERIEADRVVVAAGGWVKKLLPKETRSMEVTRQCVFHLKPSNLDAYRPGNWPVLIYNGQDEHDLFYSLPAMSDLGVKVARHGGPATDPDKTDRTVSEADWEPVHEFLKTFLPDWANAPRGVAKTCLYTMTRDEEFRLGAIERHPRVLMVSPCSGHGFKFGPLIGRIIADLCETGMCDYDIARWSPKRVADSRRASL